MSAAHLTDAQLMAATLLLPWCGALAIRLFGARETVRNAITMTTAVATLGLLVQLVPAVSAGGRPGFSVVEPLPGLPIAFSLEPLGLLYALVAVGLWVPTSLYAIGYMKATKAENLPRFFALFSASIGAALSIAMSANLLTLFIGYEVLTLSTYPLVTHRQSAFARDAARVYLGILLSTSIGLLLLAIVWTWRLAGTLDFTPGGILGGKLSDGDAMVLLGLFAFGAGKAALMPLHRWLPRAMVAPAPVSALLHAVAVVKAGVFTVLKVAVYIFGLQTLQRTAASEWLMVVASVTVVGASLIAITKHNLKARLAYSTISQLAYIVLGAALATTAGAVGGGLHIAMHAVGKITLFFCAGAVYLASHAIEIPDLDGIGRKMPWTMGAFTVGSLSIIGLPPFGGALSKWRLMVGAVDSGNAVFAGVLALSSVLSVAYLMPIIGRAFFSEPGRVARPYYLKGHGIEAARERAKVGIQEAPLPCVAALVTTAFGCLLLFFFAGDIEALLAPIGRLP